MTCLSADHLSYAYGAKVALNEVSFSIERGQFCALLGPNGAGKSTLFSLMTRLLVPQKGSIKIAGHDMANAPNTALSKLGVVFQQTTLDLDLTVEQNLTYFAALHGISSRDAKLKISAALEQMRMAERSSEKARNLNGGHRRRTEIARALIHEPEILILDEPTVGLDAAARQSITDHVHELCAEKNITVLWATHLTDEVRGADDLIILHQGKVLRTGTCDDVTGGEPLKEYFLTLTGKTPEAAI